MKFELKITYDSGEEIFFDLTDSKYFNCILQPHYDKDGELDGGTVIEKGKIIGHIDPKGQEGTSGIDYKKRNLLIEFAKENYPSGTKFMSPISNEIYTVRGNHNNSSNNNITVSVEEGRLVDVYIFLNGQWAKKV